MWYLVSALFLVIIGCSFVIYNLLNKVEKYEEDIQSKDEFLQGVKKISEDSYKRLKDLDSLEAFESDDETGHFFNNLKNIIITLDAYLKNYEK